MPKVALSDMTASDFIFRLKLLGLTYTEAAQALNRSLTSISRYAGDTLKIPVVAAQDLARLLAARKEVLARELHRTVESVSERELFEHAPSTAPQPKPPRLINRVVTHDRHKHIKYDPAAVLGKYQLTPQRFATYCKALIVWRDVIRARVREWPQYESYRVELGMVEQLLDLCRHNARRPPFIVQPTKGEFAIISSALRHEGGSDAYALYQHWRRHKGSGYIQKARKRRVHSRPRTGTTGESDVDLNKTSR